MYNQNLNDDQRTALRVFLVIQDGVQDGDAVLKHAYFPTFMSDLIL